MKIKVDVKLIGVDGNPISLSGEPALTLKEVAISALLSPMDGDDEKKKFERWEIYKKLRDCRSEVEFTIPELAIIRTCIGKHRPPLIMGQCFELLDKSENEKINKK